MFKTINCVWCGTYILINGVEPIKAEIPMTINKRDEEAGIRPVISNSHAAMRDGRPPPIPEEVPIVKEKVEDKGHEKSVLQAKLTKLAIQIGYAGKNFKVSELVLKCLEN